MFLGTPGALRERQIKKLHKTKSDQHQIILGMIPIEIDWNSKILVIPLANPAFCGLKIKIRLLSFSLHCPLVSEKVWHNPLAPKTWEEINLAEIVIFGVRAWPQRPRGPNCMPKNYLQVVPKNLTRRANVISHCGGHRRTDTHFESPWTPQGKFLCLIFYAWVGWETSNPAKCLPFNYVKDKILGRKI